MHNSITLKQEYRKQCVSNMVHIHIGKTSGTSFSKTLNDGFSGQVCSTPFIQNYMTYEEALYYSQFSIVHGHISRSDQLKWFSDRHVITILREPIDRGLSFLHYVRSLPYNAAEIAADAAHLSIFDLIETAEAQRNLNNTMVRQLGGHILDPVGSLDRLLERAKATLKEALWVGRQSHMAEDLSRLSLILGIPLDMNRANVTPNRPAHAAEDPNLIARLNELNQYDMELWTWAQTEIF